MDKADYYWEEYIADMDLIGMMAKPVEETEEEVAHEEIEEARLSSN